MSYANADEYYTRFCFYFEAGKHLATNYTRGAMVPINTRVRILKKSAQNIRITLVDTKDIVSIINVPGYTKKDINTLFDEMFSLSPTDLSGFSDEMQSAIKGGVLKLDMTKEQVLMARGYPPRHETLTLEQDRWVYWSSRFVKQTILFRDNKLAEGRGIS
ncbi:MAG: hypothetical protein GY754_31555 [bacterium]|nr:hypothetical protein [bacterium]